MSAGISNIPGRCSLRAADCCDLAEASSIVPSIKIGQLQGRLVVELSFCIAAPTQYTFHCIYAIDLATNDIIRSRLKTLYINLGYKITLVL